MKYFFKAGTQRQVPVQTLDKGITPLAEIEKAND